MYFMYVDVSRSIHKSIKSMYREIMYMPGDTTPYSDIKY